MDRKRLAEAYAQYEKELKESILPFWISQSPDQENGGYFNCFDVFGEKLACRDKYTWSQGRFLWIWSRLAATTADLFTKAERDAYLELAELGAAFLQKHCLLPAQEGKPSHCVYLMDEFGNAKIANGCDRYDSSIYADMFAMAGFAQYALASGKEDAYRFAKELYLSIEQRLTKDEMETQPYPLNEAYKAHGPLMIFLNISADLCKAAESFDPEFCAFVKACLQRCRGEILRDFVDQNGTIHEYTHKEKGFFTGTLGQHANPGHTLEDVWFLLNASDILGDAEQYLSVLTKIAFRALENGWDEPYGGLLQYCALDGGRPPAPLEEEKAEPIVRQVVNDWANKLWWVHTEALYCTLLLYLRTGAPAFLEWHNRIAEYTLSKFPNPKNPPGEWLQILSREGEPEKKIVALPVKDPYHITRDLLLCEEAIFGVHVNICK